LINPFDLIFFVLFIFFGIIGFKRGFIDETGRLIGLICAFTFSLKFYFILSEFLFSFLSFDYKLISFLSFLIIFISTIILIRILMRIVQIFLLDKGINFSNKIMGVFIGLIKSYLIGVFLFLSLDIFTNSSIMNETKSKSFFYQNSRLFSSKIIKYLNIENNIINLKIWYYNILENENE